MARRSPIVSGFILLLLVAGAFRVGQATTTVQFDAAWWRELTRTQQLAAVQGMIDGYQSGYTSGHTKGMVETIEWLNTKYVDAAFTFFVGDRERYRSLWFKAVADKRTASNAPGLSLPNFPNTFGTYVDGITHFYENNPTKADWSPGMIMECLSTTRLASCNDVQR
ncbi:MAG: hypothetical protein JO121_02455 [Deltaproteobacteria bacterium]|nr:hypothetical protein [Deltaproteobacteria bacterium]